MFFPVSSRRLAWQIGAQLVRRHRALLWLVRTYPFDGFYDCLTVRLLATPAYPPSIMFNLPGSGAAVHPMIGPRVGTDDQVVLRWHEPLLASDPRDFLLELESHAALPPPATLPPSTPSSLAIRWIAAFFAAQLGGRDRWTAHNVWPDELHLDATPFKRFPAAWEWVRQRGNDFSVLVWFLTSGKGPDIAVAANGVVWRADRKEPIDLVSTYARCQRSATALVGRTVPDLLP